MNVDLPESGVRRRPIHVTREWLDLRRFPSELLPCAPIASASQQDSMQLGDSCISELMRLLNDEFSRDF
eukprot:COSAG02_NODE_4058_length_5845_cov_3.217891_5_plen_69_part_00